MTPVTKKLLADFQIRKTKQQKASFRAWLCDELGRAGYASPGGDWRPLEQQ